MPALIIATVTLAALGYGLTLRVPESKSNGSVTGIFWSDEATYHSMAYSLAYDGDLRYDRRDLERVYAAGYGGGPSGLFLVRNPDTQQLYYAKAYAYPLAAAPFVRLFGDNGFFVLHALLLGLMLGAGYAYARRGFGDGHAVLYVLTYVLGSVATLYFFWLTPEWFNLSLLFLATFLWLYKEPLPADNAPSQVLGWLAGGWTDFAAALLYGVAIYSKPPNILLLAPLLLWTAGRGRPLKALALGALVVIVVGSLFVGTWAAIGDWNYQGGDRKSFDVLTSYPYLGPDHDFDNTGNPMTTSIADLADLGALPSVATLGRDLLYVWIGRNGGILPYMFPCVLALVAFLAAPRRRWRSPHALLIGFWLLQILAIVLVVKGNWIGGGGTVGSRYFVNSYAVMFFVLPAGIGLMGAALSWIVWGLFLAQIVLDPFSSSLNPSAHTKALPYTLLPTEVTILHNLPFNTQPRARRQTFEQPPTFFAYFLDDGTWLREGDPAGFWLKGGREAELVVRTTVPLERIQLAIHNRGAPNRVVVHHGGQRIDREIEPHGRISLSLQASEPHRYLDTYLYRFSIWSEAGTIPLFDTPGSSDARNLGVFVRPSVSPAIPLAPE